MRIRWTAAFIVAASLSVTPAPAKQQTTTQSGQLTETQERHGLKDSDLIWNLIGCLGLLGLFGMARPSDNDGYTDDPI